MMPNLQKTGTNTEKLQMIDYLSSPEGVAVFQDLEGKADDYRVTLDIPEKYGVSRVKLSAGDLRQTISHVLNFDH
jgi:hypothetical protein